MIAPDTNKEYIIGEYKFTNYIFLSLEQKLEILKWRNQDVVREKMYNTDKITEESHLSFIEKLKILTDRSYWYIEVNGHYVGSYNIVDYNPADRSCESGIFFKNTDLKSLDLNIKITKAAYDFSFNEMGIKLMRGFTQTSNEFMVNLTSYLGFTKKTITEDGYVALEMTDLDYKTRMSNRIVNMREFIKYIKSNKS